MRYLVSFKLIKTAANVALHLLDYQVPGQKQLNLIPQQPGFQWSYFSPSVGVENLAQWARCGMM